MSIVDSDTCFLQCCRYIELNSVKAKMVTQPEHYLWSSYRENANLSPSKIVGRSAFKKLSEVDFDSYRDFVAQGSCESETTFISQQIESNRLTGGDSFIEEIELRTGIRSEYK